MSAGRKTLHPSSDPSMLGVPTAASCQALLRAGGALAFTDQMESVSGLFLFNCCPS